MRIEALDPVTVPAATQAADDYVTARSEASLYHRPVWCAVVSRAFGKQTDYLAARDDAGAIVGVLPLVRLRSLLFGDFMVSMPFFNYGGALGDSPEVELSLMRHAACLAADRGVRHVEFRDTRPREGLDWPARTDKVTMLRELPDDPEALSKSLGSKLRSQVRRPLREGATVDVGGIDLLDDFYAVFSRNMRDLGTPVYARSFFRIILESLGEQALIVRVAVNGEPAAAGFVLLGAARAEIPWASSLRAYNRIGVNMLLYWEVLRTCIERGMREFDFGRSSADSGTYRFKQQWGGEPHQLHWHYWLPPGGEMPGLTPSNPKYQLAISTWRKLPLGVANALGPFIVRNLP